MNSQTNKNMNKQDGRGESLESSFLCFWLGDFPAASGRHSRPDPWGPMAPQAGPAARRSPPPGPRRQAGTPIPPGGLRPPSPLPPKSGTAGPAAQANQPGGTSRVEAKKDTPAALGKTKKLGSPDLGKLGSRGNPPSLFRRTPGRPGNPGPAIPRKGDMTPRRFPSPPPPGWGPGWTGTSRTASNEEQDPGEGLGEEGPQGLPIRPGATRPPPPGWGNGKRRTRAGRREGDPENPRAPLKSGTAWGPGRT
jgi:hypothetical protein